MDSLAATEELNMAITEKDSKIEDLCDEIDDSQELRKELQQTYTRMQNLRDSSAVQQEQFERSLQAIGEKYQGLTDWFNSKIQGLEMTIETMHEELKMSHQQLKDSEIERKQRI